MRKIRLILLMIGHFLFDNEIEMLGFVRLKNYDQLTDVNLARKLICTIWMEKKITIVLAKKGRD